MVSTVTIKRTSVPDQAPVANSLQPGELAVEMASLPDARLWVGVPPAVDPSGMRLLAPSAGGGGGGPVDAYTKAESDANEAAQDAKNLNDFVNVTGDVMSGDLTIFPGAANTPSTLYLDGSGTGTRSIVGRSGASNRWTMSLGVGANHDFALGRYDNAGALIGTPLTIIRATGQTVFSCDDVISIAADVNNPTLNFVRAGGVEHARLTHNGGGFCIFSDASLAAGVYMASGSSAWTALSDARFEYKKTATPVSDVLSRLDNVQLYTNVSPTTGKPELFAKAQELHQSFPELVEAGSGPEANNQNYVPKTGGDLNLWGVNYDRAGIVALQAIKELKAEVEALKAQLAVRK